MKKINIIALLISALSLASCAEYLNINQDPSNPQVAEGFVLLPPILQNMVRGEAFDSRFAGQYVQNWANSGGGDSWDRHGYISGSDAGGEKWSIHYFRGGKNIDLIIKDAEEKEKWDYSGVAKAIRAWSWQSTTDYTGEMILKQAWEPNRYIFDFDSQEDIYKEVERLSQDALTDLNRTDGAVSAVSLGRGDQVYRGDRTKWIKFVNAILARNAHHLSNKASYNPDKVIGFVDKALASNADNFNVPHDGTSTADANFFGPLRNNMASFRQTNFAVNLMNGIVFNGVADPRLPLIYTASPDGIFRGVIPPFGDPNNVVGNARRIPTLWGALPAAAGQTITTGKNVFQDRANHPIITFAELQFIKAEAAFRKGDMATALASYRRGIDANMDWNGVAAADKNTYLASRAVAQTTAALTMSDIMQQKYIAMIGHGCLETWVDMRRFAYNPAIYTGLILPSGSNLFADNGGKPVQRVRPRFNSEYVWNRASLDKVGGNNADYHTQEMWFTKP